MTPKQLRDSANRPLEAAEPGDTVTVNERVVGVVGAVKYCGKCFAGYVYKRGDSFNGRRCECNPRHEPCEKCGATGGPLPSCPHCFAPRTPP